MLVRFSDSIHHRHSASTSTILTDSFKILKYKRRKNDSLNISFFFFFFLGLNSSIWKKNHVTITIANMNPSLHLLFLLHIPKRMLCVSSSSLLVSLTVSTCRYRTAARGMISGLALLYCSSFGFLVGFFVKIVFCS